jgi:hypothetical protein
MTMSDADHPVAAAIARLRAPATVLAPADGPHATPWTSRAA